MNITDLKNKKICILGLGLENQALLNFLLKKNVKADYTICDARAHKKLLTLCVPLQVKARKKNIKISCSHGQNYDKHLDKYDIIFRIAGYPLHNPNIIKAMMAGVNICSPTKLFFDLCPTKNIIGVTGTKGKGTTASLIYKIITDAGRTAYLGGNIGIAMFSFLEKIKETDWVVLELSSFQIEDLHKSPHLAVITNFYPEHLAPADPNNPNYHKNLQAYWEAKTNIFAHQKKHDFLVAPKELKNKLVGEIIKAKIKYFNITKLITPLVGNHNKKNIATAEVIAAIVGIKQNSVATSVKNFQGLPHRLELVAQHQNIRYYNDTFATTPEATITALESFTPKKIILIAGGASKQSDFVILATTTKQYAKSVILLPGEGSQEIKRQLRHIKYPNIIEVKNMPQALGQAQAMACAGDIILLSPACASFGIFQNYKDRGQQFITEVKKLISH